MHTGESISVFRFRFIERLKICLSQEIKFPILLGEHPLHDAKTCGIVVKVLMYDVILSLIGCGPKETGKG